MKKIVFLIFVFVFSFGCCYAANFVDTNYTGSAVEIIDYFYTTYFNTASATTEINTNYDNLLSDLSNYGHIYIEYYYTPGTWSQRRLNISLNNITNGIDNSAQVSWNKPHKNYQIYEYQGTMRSITNTTSNQSHVYSAMGTQYNECWNCYRSNGMSFWRATNNGFFDLGDLMRVTFTPINNGTIRVYANNTYENFLKLFVSSSLNATFLGTLSNWESLPDNTQISISWSPFVNAELTDGQLYNCLYIVGRGRYYTKGVYMTDEGKIYVDNYLLYMKQGYSLDIFVAGYPIDDVPQYYYTLPYGSTDSSGDLISPDFVPDPALLQFIEGFELVGNQDISNLPANINNMFSGDNIFSGDFFGVISPTINDPDDKLNTGLIYNIFNTLYSLLYIGYSTDVTIPINVHGFSYVIHSDDFKIPDSPLKTFVTTFLVVGFIIVFSITNFILLKKIMTADFFGLITHYDFDISFFM